MPVNCFSTRGPRLESAIPARIYSVEISNRDDLRDWSTPEDYPTIPRYEHFESAILKLHWN
jgi:hypothetical protein